ncbi:MAG TPA: glycosyltransferase family 39 protein [Pseudonocardiaceae bacterium]|jgi:4-amino-4-deoxy-L-arabinose transferase-like glycosyltransferase|nr:glycosyltransferase family 39 protein [Pseudonocardiaceae bacterium]
MTAIADVTEPANSTDTPARREPPRRGRLARLVRGKPADPGWVRPALLVLLAATAGLYLVDLGVSGWANSFYAAAVQAATKSWKAFFFGSSDAGNSITVDKTPASLWVMDLSARLFGVNSWSILVPQALEGVAAVGLLYAAVRRVATPAAGLIAGAVLALTPVAVLMFRFDNPDALLVLLLVAAAYAVIRAMEQASTRWLLLAGTLVGFAFLAKMMQAFLVLPAFALVYLIVAPTGVGRRIRQLLAAGLAMVVAGGWWVLAVQLTPAADRPYIGGSQNNSVLQLALGYNGFGRLTGDESGGLGNTNQGSGLLRLFGSEMGAQISWLLPAALVLLIAGLWFTRRAPRTDRVRASLLLWAGWLVVTGLVFSLSQGIIHPYYTIALAPAIGALVGIGATVLWRERTHPLATVALSVTIAATAIWSFALLSQDSSWQPWLRVVILAGGLAAALALPLASRFGRRALAGVVLGGVLTSIAGPTAFAVVTAATAHTGPIPAAGPSGFAFGGGPGGFRSGGRFPGRGGNVGGFGGAGGAGGRGNQTFPGLGGGPGSGGATGNPAGIPGGTGGSGSRGGRGGLGGMFGGGTPSAALTSLLTKNAGSYTWAAAVVSSNQAASYQLATGDAVMPIGGFNGTDPSPTLAQFQQWVHEGKIHYFIGSGNGGSGGTAFGGAGGFAGRSGNNYSNDDAQAITSWVKQNFTASTVGGVTVYDLSHSTGT